MGLLEAGAPGLGAVSGASAFAPVIDYGPPEGRFEGGCANRGSQKNC